MKKDMTPEEKARCVIDDKLCQSGWVIQDLKRLNLTASLGVAVREFPTSTGEVDYALFVDGKPVGVVEAKQSQAGQSITDVEVQSGLMQIVRSNGLRMIILFGLRMKQQIN